MNVQHCHLVKEQGDWCFFRNETEGGRRYIKFFVPVEPIPDLPAWHFSDPRLICLPVEGPGGWKWNGDEEFPTLEPSIKTKIVVGHEEGPEPKKPIMREVYHGHLQAGFWRGA